jgi:hypothetical protein
VTVLWVLVKMDLLGIISCWLQVNKIGSLTLITFALSFQCRHRHHHHHHIIIIDGVFFLLLLFYSSSLSLQTDSLSLLHDSCTPLQQFPHCCAHVLCWGYTYVILPTTRHLCTKSVVPAFRSLCVLTSGLNVYGGRIWQPNSKYRRLLQ